MRLESGLPLRFVRSRPDAPAGLPYELAIADSGCVPTRTQGAGMQHDWLNALCWLRWPATKARLNRLQADAIRAGAIGPRRGRLRDAITLLDESGALLVTDRGATIEAWRRFDWQRLFVADREAFVASTKVLILGHALLEKLLSPYKAVCAQALPMLRPVSSCGARSGARSDMSRHVRSPVAIDPVETVDPVDRLDRLFADLFDADWLAAGQGRERFLPLPILGVPGWWPANQDPAFYNDPDVFRRRDPQEFRQRAKRRQE